MDNGITQQRTEGTPQGSPLSPLLSNIMLDEWDKELERRGHSFCQYADDCNIYVRSRKAGERVMTSLSRFLIRHLRLRVNEEKSAVARPWQRKFLGYSMTFDRKPRLKAARASVKRFKEKIRELIQQGRGRNIGKLIEDLQPLLKGWIAYFKWVEVKITFEELNGWIRRKLRCILWQQWKRPRTRAERLMRQGIAEARARQSAFNGHGSWWNAGASHMNEAFPISFFDRLGLPSLLHEHHRLQIKVPL